MTADRRATEAIGRAIRIARRIAKKDDLGVREEIESFAGSVSRRSMLRIAAFASGVVAPMPTVKTEPAQQCLRPLYRGRP